ncbi:MAG: hypothetical protein C0483_12245 [Pirellula sp.]|nr:hypothetical protein [Pirellula sp.]
MRKAALLTGGFTLLLLVPVVWGKEEPGSRGTFGQKVNSLFGLIDRGENAPPPPPPPDMPSYGVRRTPHQTVPHNSTNPSAGKQPNPGAAAAAQSSARPVPPTPQRENGFATAGDEPQPTTTSSLGGPVPPRPALLERSRTPSGANTAATTTPAASNRSNASATLATSATATRPTTNAPAAVEQSAPRSTGGAPSLPAAVMTSRRRGASDTTNAGPSTATSTAAPESEVPLSIPIATPIPTQSGAAAPRTEAFVPQTPFTADSRNARPYDNAQPPAVAERMPAALPRTIDGPPTLTPPPADTAPLAQIPVAEPRSQIQTQPSNMAAPLAQSSRQSAVLTAFNSPEITVETVGPKRISIGREATYRVLVRNRGQSQAEQVVVTVGIPQWAEIAQLHGTTGHTTSADEHAAGKPLEWTIDLLSGRAEEELTLVLIPRRSETFDLQVRWACSPAAAVAAIEVEEPQLRLSIAGPTEVSYGEQRLYKLTVANPGTGTAEDVELQLMPLTPGDGDAVAHRIGSLKAGDSISVEVELTARQAGRLQIRTEATGAGSLKTSAVADVVVHRAALEVSVAAPKMLFAGVPGTYEIRVRNTGDDQARNVRVSVDLPQGAKLIQAGPTSRNEADGALAWSLERLSAGAEQLYTVRCALGQGGTQQLTATAAADGDLRKSAHAVTTVQAVADLVLDVVDTPGPIAVGQPITYEIHVRNRGMKSAEGIDVVAFFSEGIEPEKVEGHGHELQPGMVVFKTLPSVGASQERLLKITARATTAGNHRLRVELHSANPQTDLSQEDSTFFYADEAPTTTSSNVPNTSAESMNVRYASSAAPAPFTPMNAAPINASTVGNEIPATTPGVVHAATAANISSDNRYAPVTPAAAQGAANAPATVYPATIPPRVFSNGLR